MRHPLKIPSSLISPFSTGTPLRTSFSYPFLPPASMLVKVEQGQTKFDELGKDANLEPLLSPLTAGSSRGGSNSEDPREPK